MTGKLLIWTAILGTASVGFAPGAYAANPKVTLHVENATGAEVTQALMRASGVHLEWSAPTADAGREPERASFHWERVPLSRALREIAARFHVWIGPAWSASGYRLGERTEQLGGASRVGEAVSGDFHVSVADVSVHEQDRIAFSSLTPQQADSQRESRSSFLVRIAVEMRDGDAERISGLTNVTAKDDLGHLLTAEVVAWERAAPLERPDLWIGEIRLRGRDPRARKLLWLSGELQTYPDPESYTAELPVPLPVDGVAKTPGGMRFKTLSLTPPEGAAGQAPRLELEVSRPGAERGNGSGRKQKLFATLFLASGEPAPVDISRFGTSGNRGVTTYRVSCSYGRLPEPAKRLVITFREQGEPVTALAFRLHDIPLPFASGAFPRLSAGSPTKSDPAPGNAPPFFAVGGGRLSGGVSIGKVRQLAGAVTYGLSPVPAPGHDPTPVEWQDVPIGAGGTAIRADLQPGKYRVLRSFRVTRLPDSPWNGRWENTELVVEIVRGKTTTLPPLLYVPPSAWFGFPANGSGPGATPDGPGRLLKSQSGSNGNAVGR